VSRFFLDTNVLVYADDLDAGDRRESALALVERAFASGDGVVSTQVLQEFYSVSTRRLGVDPAVARRKVELLGCLDVVMIDLELILGAIDLQRLHALSFWDALVLKAAAVSGCRTLYTEDLQAEQVIDGVRVTRPFA
jgi:predicted nucleic acid-binding protein